MGQTPKRNAKARKRAAVTGGTTASGGATDITLRRARAQPMLVTSRATALTRSAQAGEPAAADASVRAPDEREAEDTVAPVGASHAPDSITFRPRAEDDDAPAPERAREPRPTLARERGAVVVSRSVEADAAPLAQPSALSRLGERVRQLTPEQWAWIALLALASFLRFWNVGAKPLHHDESMHAYFSLMLARDPSSYAYNPLLHGPFQFHAEGFMFALLLGAQALFHAGGLAGSPWINDTTARFVPVLFGIATVALPIGLRRELGRIGALIAGFLLAISPAFVYFSRFLREDVYFNFFMGAMVVCAVQFARKRTTAWLIGLVAATILAYATFEGIFLTFAIFLGFLAAVVCWDLGASLAHALPQTLTHRERLFFSRTGLLLLLAAIGGALGLVALAVMNNLSAFINTHPKESAAQVQTLEQRTVAVLLYGSIALALLVIGSLIWQILRETAAEQREQALARAAEADVDGAEGDDALQFDGAGAFTLALDRAFVWPGQALTRLRGRLDPERQRLLYLMLSTNWVQWFVAAVVGWMLFIALYWELPGPSAPGRSAGQGFQEGIGNGVWNGLYYWLSQQQVARGGQPLYYYFLLIPLYEQLMVVFGLAGVIYALARPTRFRVFLVWWFLGSLALYSWAGEKMPWLTIHILLPLALLAALLLAQIVREVVAVTQATMQGLRAGEGATLEATLGATFGFTGAFASGQAFRAALPRMLRTTGAALGLVVALLLVIPTTWNMYELTQRDPADGPHEMMVYVQTTPDVDAVMAKINHADSVMYGGKHQLTIGVGQQEEWPFYWYLRDYYLDPHPGAYVSFDYAPDAQGQTPDTLIMLPSDAQQFVALHPNYHMKVYKLRSWWDESYKPLPCVPSKGHTCPASANWGTGVGLGNYLSYGPRATPNDRFDLGRAANRYWNWLWFRKPLGATDGSFDFAFVVRDGMPIQP